MKIIVSESSLYKVFKKFMDSNYDLNYNRWTKEFVDPNEDVFGYVTNKRFLYATYSLENFLKNMFSVNTDKMLFDYLTEKFPEVPLTGIEDETFIKK